VKAHKVGGVCFNEDEGEAGPQKKARPLPQAVLTSRYWSRPLTQAVLTSRLPFPITNFYQPDASMSFDVNSGS
jgi:hypothetical protein